MSMGPALTAIKAAAAAFTAWPLRWQNETFADKGIPVDADGNPIDASGAKVAFVMGEIIGGKNRLRSFGVVGSRTTLHPGLIRFYMCVPNGQGTDDAYTQADVLGALFEQQAITISTSSEVRAYAPSVSENTAAFEDGSMFVLMLSIDMDVYYIA
jgi:hypothetical protein